MTSITEDADGATATGRKALVVTDLGKTDSTADEGTLLVLLKALRPRPSRSLVICTLKA